MIGPEPRHCDDLGQRRPAVLDGPHHAVAEAGVGPGVDLAHDAVPDKGPPGQGRVLAQEREQQGRHGQDDSGQADQCCGHAPAHQNRHDRPTPGEPQRPDDRQADQQAEQGGLGGRQQNQHGHHRRRPGPDPAASRIVQPGGDRRDETDGHGGAQIVLLIIDTAPGAGEQLDHLALVGKQHDHEDRGDSQEGKGRRQDLRQAPPAEAGRHAIGAGAGHDHGDEAAQGRRRIDRPGHRHQAHQDQGQQQRRAYGGAEQSSPGDDRQGDAADIDGIIDQPDDTAVGRRLRRGVAEDRALPALGKAEHDQQAQGQGWPQVAPVVDKGAHAALAGDHGCPCRLDTRSTLISVE